MKLVNPTLTSLQDLRKLRAANDGNTKALSRILDLAYGRAGKLKWELLEVGLSTYESHVSYRRVCKPYMSSSTVERAPPIIPGVEKSRPPVYSRELSALLVSALSRATRKNLHPSHLKTPPSLPARVDPKSEEARLLGPLSKRRESNARWRFFRTETKKVFPPLETSVVYVDKVKGSASPSENDQPQGIQDLGLIGGGFQSVGILKSLESMTCSSDGHPATVDGEGNVTNSSLEKPPALPTRRLRRSHRNLLGKVPILTYYSKTSQSQNTPRNSGSFDVSLPKQGLSPHLRYSTVRIPYIDDENMKWVLRAREKATNNRNRS